MGVGGLSVVFSTLYPVPRTVPGAWSMLRTYLLNDWWIFSILLVTCLDLEKFFSRIPWVSYFIGIYKIPNFLILIWLGENKCGLGSGMPFLFCQPFCIHRNTSSRLWIPSIILRVCLISTRWSHFCAQLNDKGRIREKQLRACFHAAHFDSGAL